MSQGKSLNSTLLIWCILALGVPAVLAQSAGPQPLPMPPQIAVPRDIPYLGTIRLNVDATDVERHIFSIRETIPVRGGEPLTLLYPQWLPGNHSPSGRVDRLAGLTIRGNTKRLEWTRDAVDVLGAIRRTHFAPVLVVGFARSAHGPIDVFFVCISDAGQRLFGCRIYRFEILSTSR